MMILPSLL